MATELDHLIVPVNDRDASVTFYADVLGLGYDGEMEPFAVIREVGNMRGPGNEPGARGPGAALYFFDPNKHLIEIRHYDDSA